jgi:FixJ family two-component response regulator
MGTHEQLVFVVDDEESVRKALGRLLAASGLTVKVFAHGVDFVDAVSAHRPDCLVIDLHMPGLTGLDVLRQLIQLELRVPAIVITAHDEPDTRAQCIAAGARAYLCKPIDAQELLDTIQEVCGQA